MANTAMTDEMMSDGISPQSPPHPDRRQVVIDETLLMHTLEMHQQQLQETVQNEFNKRLPPIASTASSSNSASKQAYNSWGWAQFLAPAERRNEQIDRHVIDTILKKNNELQQQIDDLQKRGNAVHQQCMSLQAEGDKLRNELAHERQTNEELERKTMSLRSMLIPAQETQLTDGEVVNKFTSLRSQVLKLVKTTWRRDKLKPGIKLTALQSKILRPFVEGILDLRFLDNRLRGVVFDFLHQSILSARTYALDDEFVKLDDYLSKIEAFMWKELPKESSGRYSSIVDWRVATMKATADIRKDKYSLARAVQHQIWDFFDIFETSGDKSAAEGLQLLEKICHDAVDLSLMMRSTKDEYLVDLLATVLERPISDYEELVEEEASRPARSHSPETVAYLIAGALVKFPNGNPEDRRVLEKAQAVVYR